MLVGANKARHRVGKVALLTAGKDPHYALGIAPALADSGIAVELVGNSEMEQFPGIRHAAIQFFNLRGDQGTDASLVQKVKRVLVYYLRLLRFTWQSRASVFHILWPNKFVHFDRTLLNLYYRLFGKRLVYTAHNVNTEERDRKDSSLNRFSLKFHYRMMDHVFVHTAEMGRQLTKAYGVRPDKITVLTFPINNVTPRTSATRGDARTKLGIPEDEKTLLFFGNIAAYKGLDDLIRALPQLRNRLGRFRVLVAGNVKKDEEGHMRQVCELIEELAVSDLVDQRIGYIPEDQVELYLKAADLLILPYRRIFQSGVLFLSYSFGLPVVTTDAGSLRDEVIEGETGFVCPHSNPAGLADAIGRYFESDLFKGLEGRRQWIMDYAQKSHSWEQLVDRTSQVYDSL